MVTSQSAATAACQAIDETVPVQEVNQAKLRARLLADGQILETNGPPATKPKTTSAKPLRILPLGDSITRGSYLAQKDGKAMGMPHPLGGVWRRILQDKLRAAGIAFDFVGALNYAAFGRDGVIDPSFDPDHHGLAGFSNSRILTGGILLMSGTNDLDAAARDRLIRTIGESSRAHLLVATILPQKAPRPGWQKVDAYNASLPALVAAQKAAGKRITLVDMHAAITTDDLLADGVHPGRTGMEKMAAVWFEALNATPSGKLTRRFSRTPKSEAYK